MPITPNPVEQFAFYSLNQVPAAFLDVFGGLSFRIVHAAIKLCVFDALADAPLTATELARRIHADAHATQLLLDNLQSLGYVRQRDSRYSNTATTAKWLTRHSAINVSVAFDYWGSLLFEHFQNLEETIRTGRPAADYYDYTEHHPEHSQLFQAWLVAAARLGLDEITRKLKLPPTARRLLDVGGGHGMYTLALCRRYPNLTATIFDGPQALQAARANIAAGHLGDRVTTQEGNFVQDELGRGYDVALLFHIIHGLSPDQNTALLARVEQTLQPGGLVVIADQLAGAKGGSAVQAVIQIMGLTFYHLLAAQVYEFSDMADWLRRTGFVDAHRINLRENPGVSLVMARKS